MLSILLTAVHVLVCLFLLVVVLMQQGKGGGLQAAFGGSGSDAAFGARSSATVLTRATTVLGALFMVGSMTLAIMGQRGTGSLLSGVEGPGFQPPPASVPAETDAAETAPAETDAAETDAAETDAEAGEPAEPPEEPR